MTDSVLWLRRPTLVEVQSYLDTSRSSPFSYPEVGATRGFDPSLLSHRYTMIEHRARLGAGADAFKRAREAVASWKMFDLGWTELFPGEKGDVAVVVANVLGFWTVNPVRVVHRIDSPGAIATFGLAIGTVSGHVVCGEERLSVEFCQNDGSVDYVVRSFSRPDHWMTHLTRRYLRRVQLRFVVESSTVMQREVDGGSLDSVSLRTMPQTVAGD